MTATRSGAVSAIGGSEFGGELGSAAQRDRRERILDATIALATKGGYDAVQMRAVAERAGVALGTLYRYFPSKIHLLVSGLAREFEHGHERIGKSAVPGDTPCERVLFVLGRVTRAMQREPHLTEAMTRAFMFADTSATAEVDHVGTLVERMVTRAMRGGDPNGGDPNGGDPSNEDPSDEDKAIARIVGDVWLSTVVAWVTRRASATDVTTRLELAVRLLLKE